MGGVVPTHPGPENTSASIDSGFWQILAPKHKKGLSVYEDDF